MNHFDSYFTLVYPHNHSMFKNFNCIFIIKFLLGAGYDIKSVFKRRENCWIYTFSKGISAMWNTNRLVQG